LIQKNWQELIKPHTVDVKPGANARTTGTVVVEPLERGFGLMGWFMNFHRLMVFVKMSQILF